MSFFNGLVGGVSAGLQQTRAENAAKAERDQEREDRLLQHLATSDDPEIASMALAGMLDRHTGKPSKGLRGFLGEMEGNPALPTIQQLIRKGTAVPDVAPTGQTTTMAPSAYPESTLASAQTAGGVAAPAGQTPAAMASSSAVTPGAPPLRMGYHTVPRTVFLSPEERAGRQQEAVVRGKLTAFRAGMREARDPEERDLVRNLSGGPRRSAAYKPVTLELDNGDGTTSTTAGFFDGQGGFYDDEYTPLTNVKRILSGSGATPRPPANRYITDAQGVVHVVQGTEEVGNLGKIGKPYTPPPAFTGTATVEGEDGAEVVRLPRGGGEPQVVGARPAPAGGVTTDQALAKGVVAAIDKAIQDARIPGVPIQAGLRDRLVKARNQQFGKNWTYEQWVAQAQMGAPAQGVSGGPPPPRKKSGAKGKVPAGTTNPNDPLGIRPGG